MNKKISTGPYSIRLGKQWRTTVKLNSKIHTIRKLVIISNYKCNLHCKDCTMFIPYVKKEDQNIFDVEQLIADVEILRKGTFIRHIQIQGGEPIIYKDLDRLIIHLMTKKITPKVSIATNAMLLLNEDQIKLFRKYSVEVRMSDYSLEQQKLDQIEEQCRSNNIPYKVHRQITKNKT